MQELGNWMLDEYWIVSGATKETLQILVVEWLDDIYMSIPVKTRRNAWMKKDLHSLKQCLMPWVLILDEDNYLLVFNSMLKIQ